MNPTPTRAQHLEAAAEQLRGAADRLLILGEVWAEDLAHVTMRMRQRVLLHGEEQPR